MHRRTPVRSKRSGLTIVELLVVISAMAVVTSLLVPAVQQARETARQTECRARLKNVGVAIHGFISTHQSLPAVSHGLNGSLTTSADATPPHEALLPWLEQAAVAERVRQTKQFPNVRSPSQMPDSALRQLFLTPIAAYQCPSDGARRGNNFVFCLGTEPVARIDETSGYWGNGPFPLVGRLPLARVTDGLSNTAAVSERLVGSGDASRFDPRRDFWFSGTGPLLVQSGRWPPETDDVIRICDSAGRNPPHIGADSGWTWAATRYNGACYNHAVPPNAAHLDCTTQAVSPRSATILHGVFRAVSQHAGGVNQLFLDGSVRFLSSAIDLHVYRSLATRAGDDTHLTDWR